MIPSLTNFIFFQEQDTHNHTPLSPPYMNKVTLVREDAGLEGNQSDPFSDPPSPEGQEQDTPPVSLIDGLVEELENLNLSSKEDGVKASKALIQKHSLNIEQIKEFIDKLKQQTEPKPDKTNLQPIGNLLSYYYLENI